MNKVTRIAEKAKIVMMGSKPKSITAHITAATSAAPFSRASMFSWDLVMLLSVYS
jgi:hypothetical protein